MSELKVMTLDEFVREQGRSSSEEFEDVARRMSSKRPDVMMMLEDIVNSILDEKGVVSAVDVGEFLDTMGELDFDRRYVGAALGVMKRRGEIVSVGMVRNKRRHGSKVEVFKRPNDFLSGKQLAEIEGVKA